MLKTCWQQTMTSGLAMMEKVVSIGFIYALNAMNPSLFTQKFLGYHENEYFK